MKPHPFLSLIFSTALLTMFIFAALTPGAKTQDFAQRMARAHQSDRPIMTAIANTPPAMPVTTQTVQYATVNGNPVTGYLAQPEGVERPLPGIIAIHEWWGLNDNIRAISRRLAGEGYTVLAVDLYAGETAQTPDRARQLSQSVGQTPQAAETNLQQAYEYLVTEQNATATGVIGWCFGGGWSLQTALMLPERLDAAVIYYGQLVTEPDQLAELQMPVLGIFGAEDEVVPVATVEEFETTLDRLEKDAEIHIYENAGHAFANPSGDRYVPQAAEDSWQKTITFFSQHLQSQPVNE